MCAPAVFVVLPGADASTTIPAGLTIGAFGIGFLVAAAVTRSRFRVRNTAVVMFDLDEDVERRISDLYEGLGELRSCNGLWHVAAQGGVADRKRNAGAGALLTRNGIRIVEANPPEARTNVSVLYLPAGRERLYFLPDQLLVYDGIRRRYGAVAYADLRVDANTTRFIENGRVPGDAEVVDRTWEKVNRDGSPDRRFATNRQLPICKYGELTLRSASGLLEQFQFSHLGAADRLVSALVALGATTNQRQPHTPPATAPVAPELSIEERRTKLRAFALANLLKYVAMGDRRFDDQERAAITQAILAEFRASAWVTTHVNALVETVKAADATTLQECFGCFAEDDIEVRRRLYAHIAAGAMADGKTTPKEKARLEEVRIGLGI